MKRFSLYLSLITTLGAIPRIILLVRRGSFWFDELFTLELARMPFGEMISLASRDTSPPLWTIIMWPWVHLLPHDEWIVRIPALILGTLMIVLVGLLGRELIHNRAGLIAALFVALSPPLIYFSTEARTYALFTTLTIAALLSGACACSSGAYASSARQGPRQGPATRVLKDQSHATLTAYTITAFLLAASHLYAIIPLFATYFSFLMLLPQKAKKMWHVIHGSIALVFIAWIVFSYSARALDVVSNSWFTRVIPGAGWPFSIFSALFVLKGTLHSFLFFTITALVVMLLIVAIVRVFKKTEQRLIPLIVLLALGLAVAALIGPAKLKYFLFMLPAVALLIAWLLAEMPVRTRSLIIIFLIIAATVSTTMFIRTFRFSWDRVARVAEGEQKTAIIIPWAVNYLPFSYYYHGEHSVGAVRSPGMDAVTIPTLLASNWKWELPTEHIEKELARIVPEDGALLVIQSDPYVFGVQEWLEARGWKRDEPQTLHSVRMERYTK